MTLKDSKKIFRALADETRLRILNLLTGGELCVCDLMRVLDEPQSKISRHLGYLRDAGLVSGRRHGLWMHYKLSERGAKVFRAAFGSLCEEDGMKELGKDMHSLSGKKKTLVPCCK